MCGGIAGLFHNPSNIRHLRIEELHHAARRVHLRCREVPVDAFARGKMRREKGAAAWRTHTAAHIELRELRPLFGEAIQVRRLDEGMPLTSEIAPAEIIRENEQHVWPINRGARQ